MKDPELSIRKQADLLSLNRSSLYYKPLPPSPRELMINRKAVQRHVRGMGIHGIHPWANLSKRNRNQSVYPSLLRRLTITHPNHVWGIDITYNVLLRSSFFF